MSSNKRPRSPELPEGHALDLKLLCGANKESVLVCSQLLRDSTRSSTIKDIIAKLTEQHPHASADTPMELPVPEDSAAVWQIVWKILEKPMAEQQGLKWGNLEQVIRLADKLELTSILQACELFIITTTPISILRPYSMANSRSPPFGFIRSEDFLNTRDEIELELSFLELLCKVHMDKAFQHLAPKYLDALCHTWRERSLHRVDRAAKIKEVFEALTAHLLNSGGSEAAARVVSRLHDGLAQAIVEIE